LTIAVSEAKLITRVARRTVLSDNAMSVLVPMLEKVLRWDSARIRRLFASYGLTLLEWEKMRTDMLTIQDTADSIEASSQPQYSPGFLLILDRPRVCPPQTFACALFNPSMTLPFLPLP